MDTRRRKFGLLERIAAGVLALTLLVVLTVFSPFFLPPNDLVETAFRYTYAVVMSPGGIVGRTLFIAATVSVAILIRAAMK